MREYLRDCVLLPGYGLVRFTGLLVYLCIFLMLAMCTGCGSKQVVYKVAEGYPEDVDLSVMNEDSTPVSEEDTAEVQDEEVMLVVHLCGAVKNPGVYELDLDSRIIDGVDKAGGFTEDASRDSLNLAMELTDGSRIYVPTIEEAEAYQYQNVSDAGIDRSDGKVNINTADEDKLMTLKGVGSTRALAIIEYREAHGAFAAPEDIMNVSGIGQASYEKIKDEICVR